MVIRAVVFDIGGVLETTPDLGITEDWESRLGLAAGELDERMHDAWVGGSVGTLTEGDVHRAITANLGLTRERLDVRPEETVFLDDAEPCVVGARKAGIHAVRYWDNVQAIGEIEELLASA